MMTLTFNHEAEAIAIMHHITQFAQENNNIVQAEEDSFLLNILYLQIQSVYSQ